MRAPDVFLRHHAHRDMETGRLGLLWGQKAVSYALRLGETRQKSKGQERNAGVYLYRRALRTTCIWEHFETT